MNFFSTEMRSTNDEAAAAAADDEAAAGGSRLRKHAFVIVVVARASPYLRERRGEQAKDKGCGRSG